MALFHLEAKIHSKKTKSGGQKSISSIVAYRHCFKIEGFDYSNKPGFINSFMMFPEQVVNNAINSPNLDKFFDIETKKELQENIKNGNPVLFWKAIEAKEKRKDAQFCEELIISLQHELSLEENIKNLKQLIQKHYIEKGKAADICIHNTNNNLHAHVLITQRPVTSIRIDMKGNPTYEFGNKIRDQFFSAHGKMDQISPVREEWANLCNKSFQNAGLDISISEKTLKAQKEIALKQGNEILAAELDREPVKHIALPRLTEEEKRKAQRANEMRIEQDKNAKELAEIGAISYEDYLKVKPELKPVTFKEALQQRKQQRLKRIIENVTKYIEIRADKYSSRLRKARKRATNVIKSVTNVARNKQNRILASFIKNDYSESVTNVEAISGIGKSESRNISNNNNNKPKLIDKKIERLSLALEIDKELENRQPKQKLWYDPKTAYKPKLPTWKID